MYIHCIAGVIPSDVLLISNLNEDNIAYNSQIITFLCTTRGTGTILSWYSEDYIGSGSGGLALEFSSVHHPGRTETSPTNPKTIGTLISTSTNTSSNVTEIVSVLNITADIQYPNSNITCRVNGNGTHNTTEFQTIMRK